MVGFDLGPSELNLGLRNDSGGARAQSLALDLSSRVPRNQDQAPPNASGNFPAQAADSTGWPGTHTCLPRPGASILSGYSLGPRKDGI